MPKMSMVESMFCRSSPWQAIARQIVPWATAGRLLDGEVLELGGGSGAMAEALASANPTMHLTTTDFDPAMVAVACDRLADQAHVDARQADATQMPFEDESFDSIVSFLMLHHVIDWEKAVAETARVLRPGGMFLGYDLTASRAASWLHIADRSPHRLIGRDELEPVLRDVGMEPVTIDYSLGGTVFRFMARRPMT